LFKHALGLKNITTTEIEKWQLTDSNETKSRSIKITFKKLKFYYPQQCSVYRYSTKASRAEQTTEANDSNFKLNIVKNPSRSEANQLAI